MQLVTMARFIISEIRLRHARECEQRAQIEASRAETVPDAQIEAIKAFLAKKPFGDRTRDARDFAQLVTGKRIPLPGKSKCMGRLRLGVTIANDSGHGLAIGENVLSMTRDGDIVRVLEGNVCAPGFYMYRSEARPMTPEEADVFLRSIEADIRGFAVIVSAMGVGRLCGSVEDSFPAETPVAPVAPVATA